MTLANPRPLSGFYDVLRPYISSVRFSQQLYQQVDGQGDGSFLVEDIADPLWMAEISFDSTAMPEGRRLRALLNSVAPPARFYLCDPVAEFPQSDPDGGLLGENEVKVLDIGDDNVSIAFTGLPQDYVLSVGDYFHIDYGADPPRRAFFELQEDGAANGAGETGFITVSPAVPVGIAADAECIFKRPSCEMMLTPGQLQQFTFGSGRRGTGAQLQAIQRL